MPLDAFERTINAVSDNDSGWWPFLWLRPHRHVPLSLSRLAMMSVLYGAPVGTLLSLGFATYYPSEKVMAPLLAIAFPVLLLLVTTALIGPMWNRRAQRLRARLR